ncbi:hypothetical protein ABZ464_16655 [Streptomyces sp. NPDC005820]|uniref:hypothetical protein n=1 Tax=Streptomyces sp. NPDC005820 TaxID=3157069 RepID=UPI0033CB8F9D
MDPRLFLALCRTALASAVPLMLTQLLLQLWDEGFGWDSLRGALYVPLIWAVFTVAWATAGCFSLTRRARGTGLPVTVDALEETQYVTVPGDLTRVHEALRAAERSVDVRETPEGELVFAWRPFRGRRQVSGSAAHDESGGGVRLTVSAGDVSPGAAFLTKGSAFIAICQLTRAVSP